MNFHKLMYWIATGILSLIMLFSVYNYFFNYETIAGYFQHFGYPGYLVYPLAVAKLFGLSAIWGNFSGFLKEWAYAGFFFNTLLAFFAHYIPDGANYLLALIAFIATLVSYFSWKKLKP